MIKSFLYFFLIVLACCGPRGKDSTSVFFGGEIVNPTSNYVVLFKGDMALDSAKLNEQNRFSFSLDSVTEGLYHFNHNPELQYVYLKQGDSLAIRLNTLYFDESLIFSGNGEGINNFLLERFLKHEEENSFVRSLYLLEATEFEEKIDSLIDTGLGALTDLKQEDDISEKEENIARASIVYHYDTFKEEYPFKHKRLTGQKDIVKMPEDFYDYRTKLNFNDQDLTYLRPYYNFMLNHVGNLSYMNCKHHCDIKNGEVQNQLHFNKHKLKIIDSLFTERELKDNLFRYVAFDYLLNAHESEKDNEKFIEDFHQLSENNRHMKEIETLYEGIKNIRPNKKIPDVKVTNIEGKSVSLRDIAQGKENKTVFYFWSGSNRVHFENMKRRIAYLSSTNTRYHFVGINIRTSEPVWRGLVESSGMNRQLQYRSADFDALTKVLIIDKPNKCIITENDIIVDAFANVYGPL